jgi:hypothetical protein
MCLCLVAALRRADQPSKKSYDYLKLRNWSHASVSRMPYAPSGGNKKKEEEEKMNYINH